MRVVDVDGIVAMACRKCRFLVDLCYIGVFDEMDSSLYPARRTRIAMVYSS